MLKKFMFYNFMFRFNFLIFWGMNEGCFGGLLKFQIFFGVLEISDIFGGER